MEKGRRKRWGGVTPEAAITIAATQHNVAKELGNEFRNDLTTTNSEMRWTNKECSDKGSNIIVRTDEETKAKRGINRATNKAEGTSQSFDSVE
jgi:hypothetical protein